MRTARGPQEGTGNADQAPGLLTVLSLVCRRRRVILLSVLTAIMAAGLYCFFAPPEFMSDTAILVIKKNPSLPLPRTDSKQEVDPYIGDDLLATHMLILVSPTVVDNALSNNGLDQLPSIVSSLDDHQTPTEYVIDNLRVTRGGEGQGRAAHILNVQFRHSSAHDCAVVLQSLVESYRGFIKETFQGGIGEAVAFIEQASKDLEQELLQIEAEYQAFLEKTPVIRKGGETLNIYIDSMEKYKSALTDVRQQMMEIESRLQVVRGAFANRANVTESDLKNLPLIDQRHIDRMLLIPKVHAGEQNSAVSTATLAQLSARSNVEHDQLIKLLLKETELISRGLGPDHPKVKQVRQSIRKAEQLVAEKAADLDRLGESAKLDPAVVVKAYFGVLQSDLADLKRREKRLVAWLNQERKAANSLVADELTEEKLRSRKARVQLLYDAVVERLDEVNLTKDYAGFVTSVISPVELGEQVSPRPLLCLSLGALLGLCLGSALAIIFDFTQRTFFSPADINWTLQLPVLGHLPRFTNGRVVTGTHHSKLDPTLVTYHRPASSAAEAFRSLQMSLYHNGLDTPVKVVQVTSPTPADGKSTLAANLAITLAQGGKQVLLLDANLQRPRLGTLFAQPSDIGLSSLLAGQADLQEIVRQTDVPNLRLIPAGPQSSIAPGQLNGKSFAGLLDQVRDQYDHIIVDSPAVLDTSDAMQLATSVDGVLFVVHVGKNSDCALQARDMLSSVSGNFLGVAVNVDAGRRSWGARYEVGNIVYDHAEHEFNNTTERLPGHLATTV